MRATEEGGENIYIYSNHNRKVLTTEGRTGVVVGGGYWECCFLVFLFPSLHSVLNPPSLSLSLSLALSLSLTFSLASTKRLHSQIDLSPPSEGLDGKCVCVSMYNYVCYVLFKSVFVCVCVQ